MNKLLGMDEQCVFRPERELSMVYLTQLWLFRKGKSSRVE
jgi:hypothetical protein